jgi:hypothetical protein
MRLRVGQRVRQLIRSVANLKLEPLVLPTLDAADHLLDRAAKKRIRTAALSAPLQ